MKPEVVVRKPSMCVRWFVSIKFPASWNMLPREANIGFKNRIDAKEFANSIAAELGGLKVRVES